MFDVWKGVQFPKHVLGLFRAMTQFRVSNEGMLYWTEKDLQLLHFITFDPLLYVLCLIITSSQPPFEKVNDQSLKAHNVPAVYHHCHQSNISRAI